MGIGIGRQRKGGHCWECSVGFECSFGEEYEALLGGRELYINAVHQKSLRRIGLTLHERVLLKIVSY